jgi:ParB-like chromosome segregation protein Spo0J
MSKILTASPSEFTVSIDPRGADAKPVNIPALAASLSDEGQLVPVLAHKAEDGTFCIDGGRRRLAAAKLIVSGFEFGGKKYPANPDFKLAFIEVEGRDPAAAYVTAILENNRENLTDAQEAAAHAYGREAFGWDDKEIRRIFGYTNNNRVAALRTFGESDKAIKSLYGKYLSLDACVTLAKAKVSEKKKESLIAGVLEGKLATTRQIIDAIGAKKEEKATGEAEGGDEGEGDGEKDTPIRARNVAALEKLVAEEEFPEKAQVIFKATIEWLRGQSQTPRGIWNALAKAGISV